MGGRREETKAQRAYYERTAGGYDKLHGGADAHEVGLRHLSAFIGMLGVRSVLDVGAGTGRAMRWLLDHHSDLRVIGVEPVPALVKQAVGVNGVPRDRVALGEGERLPFAHGSFDAVCEFGVLHHVRRPAEVIAEMTRVARRAVFISDSNRFGQGRLMARLAKLALYHARLWDAANFLKTRGKGYSRSEGDGLSYSYSVYDSLPALFHWADRVVLVPTVPAAGPPWMHPLLTASHVLLCAYVAEPEPR